jgi:ADP-dependent NAD(P)H-hydrate dehydratase / NAD(P)H-hydrate epimerase
VAAVAASGLPVLAVDVPSGVDADRAVPPGPCVRATRTLQLAGAVPASLLAPAARRVRGEPRWSTSASRASAARARRRTRRRRRWLATHAPRRADDAHKYRAGTVLVVGGSRRYAGAPELSARAAYRSGAGLVTLVSDERAPDGWPEVVWEPPQSTRT